MNDHFMNFLTIPPTTTRTNVKPQPKLTRVFSQPNLTNFKNALSNLTWNDVITLNNVDSCFDVFWDSFNTLYELHFPQTKVTFNKNIHQSSASCERRRLAPRLLMQH